MILKTNSKVSNYKKLKTKSGPKNQRKKKVKTILNQADFH